jgi:hypothetical protein
MSPGDLAWPWRRAPLAGADWRFELQQDSLADWLFSGGGDAAEEDFISKATTTCIDC